jgi:hypothetical protein
MLIKMHSHKNLLMGIVFGTPSPVERRVHRLCGKKKCKAGAFIFSYRSPRSGQEPFGLKGGEHWQTTRHRNSRIKKIITTK